MKGFIIVFIFSLIGTASFSQEIAIDEAIEMMKKTSTAYLKGEFTKVDATGVDQYVDVEITSVHNFSDFSVGAVLPYFEAYLSEQQTKYGGTHREAENQRLLEYARDNMTKIVSYAAVVDYNGITKYHEKESLSRLFFFDWTGKLIAIRNRDFERGDYKEKLPVVMEYRLLMELSRMYDPLFLPFDTYISDTQTEKGGKYEYEMTWCYKLYRDKPREERPRTGEAKIIYYQIQRDHFESKSVTVIDCQYEWTKNGIEFSYYTSNVALYLVQPEFVSTYNPEDFASLKEDQLSYSIINTPTAKKMIRTSSNVPKVFIPEGDSFTMSVPVQDRVFTFKLKNAMEW